MKFVIAAALALLAATSLPAQPVAAPPTSATPEPTDFSTATPLGGMWTYTGASGGSEATFANAAAQSQLTVRCTRATRQVTISKPAAAAAPFLNLWTSTQTRNLAASFNPATGLLSATVPAFDPVLDALAFSRGRFAVSVSGSPAIVLPAWAEVPRVIEDCRV